MHRVDGVAGLQVVEESVVERGGAGRQLETVAGPAPVRQACQILQSSPGSSPVSANIN